MSATLLGHTDSTGPISYVLTALDQDEHRAGHRALAWPLQAPLADDGFS
jgi:hypothetical protein